jgi:hypothetical protein
MDLTSVLLGGMLGPLVASLFGRVPENDLYEIDVRRLAEAWAGERVSPADPRALRHAELMELIQFLVRQYPEVLRVEKAGASVEGREIFLVSAGNGPDHILLWSQMHGDEPTATGALIDLISFMGRHREESWVARILARYTLLLIPMLNPDGAERGWRRNVQGLDINRDARALQTPEGRILESVRDRYRPFLGFNLHNQSSLTTVGNTGRTATVALLAVAADRVPMEAGTAARGEGLLLSRRVASVIYKALSPFVCGHISRYDEPFNPRAFGDNMTLRGTPTVLIESGGQAPELFPDFGVKLNFVGICAALDSLASDRTGNADPAVYDKLELNSDTPIFDLILQGAWIFCGRPVPLFKGDVAIRKDLRSGSGTEAIIADVGDLGVFTAHRTLDCSGGLLTPGLIGWDSRRPPGAGDAEDDRRYLRSGITTVLQTFRLDGSSQAAPPVTVFASGRRPVNWGFLVEGPWPRSPEDRMRMAQWLAAGGRAWISDPGRFQPSSSGSPDIAGWFGAESLDRDTAARYEIPQAFLGNPWAVLPCWTSEAASTFRIPRRGLIAPGTVADLVLWKGDNAGYPSDLSSLRPSAVILNGRLLDPDRPEPVGRFLGR